MIRRYYIEILKKYTGSEGTPKDFYPYGTIDLMCEFLIRNSKKSVLVGNNNGLKSILEKNYSHDTFLPMDLITTIPNR